MFKTARLKLTLSYALVIMAISFFFSFLAYQRVGFEFKTRLGVIERRLDFNTPPVLPPPGETTLFVRDLDEVKHRVLLALVTLNGVILFIAVGSGYLLSGLTLKPIEKAMEEQKRFVADASHELRTPLTALNTSLEVALRSRQLSPKQAREVLNQAHADTQDLIKLTNDLLLLSRGRNHTHFKKLNLKAVIESAVNKIKPLAKQKKIKFNLNLAKIRLMGEEESLQKLLMILLDNAVKYSLVGGKVEVLVKKTDNQVVIQVSDKGIGISKKDLPRIFDRFYRADSSRSKQKVAGFGLGLAIAKKIVDQHHGTIAVESESGKGTTVTVKLPR